MLNEIKEAVYNRLAKHKITHVSMTHDKTRMFVDMDVDIAGVGLQRTTSHILIEGNNKDILKNKWILTRVIVWNRRQLKDERTILSEKTKREIWDFVMKEVNKVDKVKRGAIYG